MWELIKKLHFFIRYESVVCTRACICTLTPICVGRSEDNLGESVVSSLMWVSEMKPVTKVVRLGESVLTHRGITLTVHFSLFLQFQTDHTVSLVVFSPWADFPGRRTEEKFCWDRETLQKHSSLFLDEVLPNKEVVQFRERTLDVDRIAVDNQMRWWLGSVVNMTLSTII